MKEGVEQKEPEKAQQQPAGAKPMTSLPCGVCSTAVLQPQPRHLESKF